MITMITMKRNIFVVALLYFNLMILSFGTNIVDAQFTTKCTDNPNQKDFEIVLTYDDGTTATPKCAYSYTSSNTFNGDATLPADGLDKVQWTTQGGEIFSYLETQQIFVPTNKRPTRISVNDIRTPANQQNNCGRALYKDKQIDFAFGPGANQFLDLTKWWPVDNVDPLQITVVPFAGTVLSGGPGCNPTNADTSFDTARSLALWLSTDEGITTDPNLAQIQYCNVVVNPADCLNEPFWEVVESTIAGVVNNELVYYGTLQKFFRTNILLANPKELSIFIPEEYDLNIPINNLLLRYPIVPDSIAPGNVANCITFVTDQTIPCLVNDYISGGETYSNKITISGLGRINGFGSLSYPVQYTDRYEANNSLFRNTGGGIDGSTNMVGDPEQFASFIMSANLLSVASNVASADQSAKTGFCTSNRFAIDISGVAIAWGSRLGQGMVNVNSAFFQSDDTSNFCTKMYDVKNVGKNE
jgi:hypothetical protein